MTDSLHILNGDSTLHLFKKTQLSGKTFVWRDVLAEGPVHPEFDSDQFWLEREAFMTKNFSIKPGDFRKDLVDTFKDLKTSLSNYNEIILWFEYDLFCQINMMALIHWLSNLREPHQTISLVCAGKINESDRLYGLGELQPEKLEELYKNRLKLNTREFEFASDIYKAYSTGDLDQLYTFSIMPSDEFIYLSDALKTHFKRFPFLNIGLNEIEQKILELVRSGISSDKKLIGKLLRWQEYYGFGDLQYFNILESLKTLFEDFKMLKLKTEPELSSAIKNLNRNVQLGGTHLKDWEFDPENKEIIKSTF